MELFIANCAKQQHDFHWWEPEAKRPFNRIIAPGNQIVIKNADKAVLESIVEQHRTYGMVESHDRRAKVANLVYQFDKPMNIDAIKAGLERHDEMLAEKGLEIRKAAAVAANDQLVKTAAETGAEINSFELEVIEQSKGPADSGDKFKQTIEVKEEGAPQKRKYTRRA